jgi:uncharacterized repeat protein (TIGR03803 family)
MRVAALVFCGALIAGCSQMSGPPALPVAPSNVTVAPLGADSYGQYESLYSFHGKASGGSPQSDLVAVNGDLYGTSSSYGGGYGTVFKVSGLGKVTVLHTFNGFPDGAYPEAGLVWYKDKLYGTTSAGGRHGGGTVFEITTAGVERVLHSFKGSDGEQPESGLTVYDGILYGTTQNGGPKNLGNIFEITPFGQERTLHNFTGSPHDGGHATAGLTLVRGEFYGVTRAGGKNPAGGTVFKINPFGQIKLLHSFKVRPGDGSNPAGNLVYLNGILYGTTLHGGDVGRGYGTVFEITTDGVEGVMHSFGKSDDGAFPAAGLTVVKDAFYGTTTGGGLSPRRSNQCISSGADPLNAGYYKCGTVFEINRNGAEHVVYRFKGQPDGANPEARLTLYGDILYGTTDWGGAATYYGTLFRLFP